MQKKREYRAWLSGLTFAALLILNGLTAMAQAQDNAAGSTPPPGADTDAFQETYQNWVVTCVTPQAVAGEPLARMCEMRQDLRRADGKQRVLTLAIRALSDGTVPASITMVTPFGLLLEQPLRRQHAHAWHSRDAPALAVRQGQRRIWWRLEQQWLGQNRWLESPVVS